MSSLPAILAFALDNGGGAYAQMLLQLLPQGKLRLAADGILYKLLLASADELDRVDGRAADLLDESDPLTTDELLPEHERELALTPAATVDERRANVVARLIRRQRFRPQDFKDALAPLLGLQPFQIEVIERSRAEVIAMGDDREIYRFFIWRPTDLPGTAFIASAQALVDSMKPSHTVGTVIESISFAFDDPHSLFDRDLLGA